MPFKNSCLYMQIFHQFFWTFISFLVFHRFFSVCFENPIISVLKLRLSERALLKNSIKKEIADRKYFDEKTVLLRTSKKDKIDHYVAESLSKSERVWQEGLIRVKLDTEALCSKTLSIKDLSDELIDSVYIKVIESFFSDVS